MKRYVMTAAEQELWQKVYAAAFTSEFERNYNLLLNIDASPLDRTVQCMSGEYAATIADVAVMKLRQWRETDGAEAGQVIDWPEDWQES